LASKFLNFAGISPTAKCSIWNPAMQYDDLSQNTNCIWNKSYNLINSLHNLVYYWEGWKLKLLRAGEVLPKFFKSLNSTIYANENILNIQSHLKEKHPMACGRFQPNNI
jgi:hypothetical protein